MSETPWLDDMLADVGVHEIAGPKASEKVLSYFADVGHPECKSDEIAWCAARVGSALKRSHLPIPPVNVNLLARSYLTWGVPCEPKRGAIVVFPRGSSTWQGHVGCVVGVHGSRVRYIAGNQSDAVGYGEAAISSALGFRWPVEASVPALRKAGSTEIAKADKVQNAGWMVTVVPSIIAAFNSLFGKVEVPQFADLKEGLSWWQEILGGANAIAGLVSSHPWLAGTLIVGAILVLLGHQLKAARVAKAKAGVPLSAQVAALGSA
jgi:uncharacterized protein (TIGR02594 family)